MWWLPYHAWLGLSTGGKAHSAAILRLDTRCRTEYGRAAKSGAEGMG